MEIRADLLPTQNIVERRVVGEMETPEQPFDVNVYFTLIPRLPGNARLATCNNELPKPAWLGRNLSECPPSWKRRHGPNKELASCRVRKQFRSIYASDKR